MRSRCLLIATAAAIIVITLHPANAQDLRHLIGTIPSDPTDNRDLRATDIPCVGVDQEGISTWGNHEVLTSTHQPSFTGPFRANNTHQTNEPFTYHRGRVAGGSVLCVKTGLSLADAKVYCAEHEECVAFTYPVWSLEGLNHLPNATFVSTLDAFTPSRSDEWRTYVSNDSAKAEFVHADALPHGEDEHDRPYNTCCNRIDVPSIEEVEAADTTLERISCDISRDEFYVRYESPRKPVMLEGCSDGWAANTEWTYDKLAPRFSNSSRWRARLGSRTEDYREGVPWENIANAIRDNERFYVFDQLDDDEAKSIENDYKDPLPVRGADLYGEMKRRSIDFDGGPLRWFVMGRFGSGTHVHNDPFATDAWNTLIQGHKWWVIYPPAVKHVDSLKCDPSCSGEEPFVREWAASVGVNAARTEYAPDEYPYHVLQKPGETIYVPHGWLHSVFNLDATIAITANYGSPTNLDEVWKTVCTSNDARKWKILYNLVLNKEQRHQVRQSKYWPPRQFCSGDDNGSKSDKRLHAPRAELKDVFYDDDDILWFPKEGDTVEARYRGNFNEYYKGKIKRVNDDGTYYIRYFDGDKDLSLPRWALRKFAPLGEGEVVQALYTDRHERERWLLASIQKARNDGTFDLQISLGPFLESFPFTNIRRFDWQFRVGNRVVAQREDETWRSGIVSQARSDGTYNIRFDDDGHYRTVEKDLIRYEWAWATSENNY